MLSEAFSPRRGRPLGRRLCSEPVLVAILFAHASSPYGRSRRRQLRSASSSAGDCASCTRASQFRGRGTGQSSRNSAAPGSCVQCGSRLYKLPHGQFCARLTNPARSGLRSTYRQTFRKCGVTMPRRELDRKNSLNGSIELICLIARRRAGSQAYAFTGRQNRQALPFVTSNSPEVCRSARVGDFPAFCCGLCFANFEIQWESVPANRKRLARKLPPANRSLVSLIFSSCAAMEIRT